MHEVSKERHKYAVALRGLVRLYEEDCHEEHVVTLRVILTIGDLLEAGCLTGLRPALQLVKRRISLTHPDTRRKHRVMRRALRDLREGAKPYQQDPEIAELIYALETVYRVLGMSPNRLALSRDQGAKVSIGVFLSQEVTAAAVPLLAAAAVRRRAAA